MPLSIEEQAAIFRATADRLERVGWIQFAARNFSGECTQQAMHQVYLDRRSGLATLPPDDLGGLGCMCLRCSGFIGDDLITLYRTFTKYVGAAPSGDVPRWNDADGRTVAEVLDALRGCAAMLEDRAGAITAKADAIERELRDMIHEYKRLAFPSGVFQSG